jgi:hypothetical protein
VGQAARVSELQQELTAAHDREQQEHAQAPLASHPSDVSLEPGSPRGLADLSAAAGGQVLLQA